VWAVRIGLLDKNTTQRSNTVLRMTALLTGRGGVRVAEGGGGGGRGGEGETYLDTPVQLSCCYHNQVVFSCPLPANISPTAVTILLQQQK
jgi:hypothetical protein